MLDALKPALRERSTLINDIAQPADGDFVLYWMHHAMRAHDNPALDAAIEIGSALGKPVLVYQGLSGNHRFDSDRHHYFILRGARDVCRELGERNIAYQLFVPDLTTTTTPLHALLDCAAAAVFEHMPVTPFTHWHPRIASHATVPVIRTDARCIAPMTLPGVPTDRAFRFRDALADEYIQRIAAGWIASAYDNKVLASQNVFNPTPIEDQSDRDILALISTLPINHSVGPVTDTLGGTVAGYARWQQFQQQSLKSYHRTRNDAALTQPHGVSRMSAYLHYGQVSPFRLASDAAAVGGSGADKFIEELTIWRELAHHFCAQSQDTDSLRALPDWAQQTLNDAAGDAREQTYSLNTLQRAQTTQPLWDLAQRSLLAHGELHNNLRMTWAKAIASWRPSPALALDALLDLNHRYALDGNDPSSYGGLLWALGLFDRPFVPATNVLGTVRSRSITAHARRLDMPAYQNHVNRTQGTKMRIAIIGAGVSGLAAAQTLQDHNHDVCVFEKSRGPGGRTATRRNDNGFVDHGAQYFTMRDPRFAQLRDSLLEDNIIEAWPTRVKGIDRNDDVARWRGVGGMNTLCKYLARGVNILAGQRVVNMSRRGTGWQLTIALAEDGEHTEDFDLVIVTAPAPQTAQLLQNVHAEFAQQAAQVRYSSCWALMLQTDAKVPTPAWQARRISAGPAAWIARRATSSATQWVLHASPQWSDDHLEQSTDAVCASLAQAFAEATGIAPDALHNATAHRWRYGRVLNPLKCDALFDAGSRIGACGDWCGDSSRVEAAFLSGQAVAGRVLATAGLEFSLQ